MKFITVSGIDKSGKTTIIDSFMRRTNCEHFLVDRDPTNFKSLNDVQLRTGYSLREYRTFIAKFNSVVDLSVLLVCDVEVLKERFALTNEPKLAGRYSMKTHQEIIMTNFNNANYNNALIIDTSKVSVDEAVQTIIDKIGNNNANK